MPSALTGDRAHAEDRAKGTLLRACLLRSPAVIDELRSLRFSNEACLRDGSGTRDRAGADQVDAVLDRL